MESTETVKTFIAQMVKALAAIDPQKPSAQEFISKLITQLQMGKLSRTALQPSREARSPEWSLVLENSSAQSTRHLLVALQQLEPLFSWLGGVHFWPEPENEYFSSKLWGALLIGQEDATFSADDRYIALLGILSANSTYPLHQHRIEEAYFVLSGVAEWSHDGKDWEKLPPGSLFHNNSHQPHVYRTADEPLLFISFYLPPYGWEGGLVEG